MVSLFSGAGISDVGFDRAGFEHVAQVEIDKDANSVRRRRFPQEIHYTDVREFDAKRFAGSVDVVAGGFPCQDYSVAGGRTGLAGDRGALWWEFHRVVRESRPRFVVGENVPGLLSSGGGECFETIVSSLVELGYRVAWRVLDLRYFRVPQRRRRVFLVGSLGDGSCAEILFEPESLPGDFEAGGETGEGVASASEEVLGSRCFPSVAATLARHDGGCNEPAVVPLVGDCAHTLRGSGFDASEDGTGRGTPIVPVANSLRASVRGVSDPDRDTYIPIAFGWNKSASQTIRCDEGATDSLQASPTSNPAVAVAKQVQWSSGGGEMLNDSAQALRANAEHNYQFLLENSQVRRLTPRECERLMGLPDDYTRWGDDGREMSDSARYKMIGNGWSVPQAEWIARRIVEVPA